MPLKNEFDRKSYWIVIFRALTGAVIGSVPGVIYFLYGDRDPTSNAFSIALIQAGTVIGTLTMGMAAMTATLVAALKNRGTGPKTNRLKEYFHPETLPAIPPSSKPAKDHRVAEAPAGPSLTHSEDIPESKSTQPVLQPDQPVFEDYDR